MPILVDEENAIHGTKNETKAKTQIKEDFTGRSINCAASHTCRGAAQRT